MSLPTLGGGGGFGEMSLRQIGYEGGYWPECVDGAWVEFWRYAGPNRAGQLSSAKVKGAIGHGAISP